MVSQLLAHFTYVMLSLPAVGIQLTSGLEGCPRDGVTEGRGKTDGFGAQMLSMLSVFAWAEEQNLTYCTWRWQGMGHGENGGQMFDFVGGPRYGPPSKPSTFMSKNKQKVVSWQHAPRARQAARAYYLAAPKPPLQWFDQSKTTVAIHIRGSNEIVQHNKLINPRRWVKWRYLRACMAYINETTPHPYNLHVFTDAESLDLDPISAFKPTIHRGANLQTSFHHMVMADKFILAKSSLSDSIAYLRSSDVSTFYPWTTMRNLSFLRLNRYLGRSCVLALCPAGSSDLSCDIGWDSDVGLW